MSAPLRRLRAGWQLLQWRQLALRPGHCPFCGPTVLLRLSANETGVRCARCAAGVVHLSLGWALRGQVGDLRGLDACELSSRGPLVDWLRRSTRSLALSEFLDGVAPGELRDGVRCEDVQRLTYPDRAFDLLCHSEVFEHVADDRRGFAESLRVLRPGGHLLFSVPLTGQERTVERARAEAGGIEHLLPPTYHCDLIRGADAVLVFRDYGSDILQRLRDAGFVDARILPRDRRLPWGQGRNVIHARKDPAA